MNKYLLTRILAVCLSSKKAKFEVRCSTTEYFYIFTTKDGVIEVEAGNLSDNRSIVSTSHDSVSTLSLPDIKYNVDSITETVYTYSGQPYTITAYNCLDDVNIYLPIFRVLEEQVVFIAQTPSGNFLNIYFVNGRAFYMSEDEDTVYGVQTSIRKLFGREKMKLVLFDKLPRKQTYRSLIASMEVYAKKNNKKFSMVKNGVVMEGV